MIEAARELRSSHGVLAAKAEGPALDHYFETKRAMLDALAARDQALCVDFLYGGGNGDFAAFSRDHRGLFATWPTPDSTPSTTDRRSASSGTRRTRRFHTLENALRAQGVSNAAIGALLDGKAPNPPLDDSEMCQAGQTFLQTLAALPEAAAAAHLRLRRRADVALLRRGRRRDPAQTLKGLLEVSADGPRRRVLAAAKPRIRTISRPAHFTTRLRIYFMMVFWQTVIIK